MNVAVERLDHLGMVAGVCEEIGLRAYFDRLDEGIHARVSLGQAVQAMVLNGLGSALDDFTWSHSSLSTNQWSV